MTVAEVNEKIKLMGELECGHYGVTTHIPNYAPVKSYSSKSMVAMYVSALMDDYARNFPKDRVLFVITKEKADGEIIDAITIYNK